MCVYVCVCVCVCAHTLSCVGLFASRLETARLFCPWDFIGKDTGVSCHFLLQEIFPTLGSNPCLLYLLYWQADVMKIS